MTTARKLPAGAVVARAVQAGAQVMPPAQPPQAGLAKLQAAAG